jgi:hypothetical protein
MIKNLICIQFLFFTVILLDSCVSLSGFEEGRSLKEEQSVIQLHLNSMQINDFSSTGDNIFNTDFFPNLEIGYKYGFSDAFDLGLKVNTFGNIGVNSKYQIVGDQQSSFAMSLGMEFNSFAAFRLFNAHLPLYMSYYPAEKWTLNFAPRYALQFGSGFSDDVIRALQYAGGNVGILYGRKHKIGIDFGYHQLFAPDESVGMINVGIGGRFLITGGSK